jgi:hypothetical protein
MMTVSTEAPLSGHAGFQISKTIRCFWRSLYNSKMIKTQFFNVKNLIKRFVYWLYKMYGCGNTGLYLKVWKYVTFHSVSMAHDAACTVCQVTGCCVETGLVLYQYSSKIL